MKVFGLQMTLDGKEIQLGEIETISCRGCGKRLVRNVNSPAFTRDAEKYYYCSECQRDLEREVKWTEGYGIRIFKTRKL